MKESDCLLAKFHFQKDFLTLQRRIKDELHLVSALVAPAAPPGVLTYRWKLGLVAHPSVKIFVLFLSVTAVKSCYSIIKKKAPQNRRSS